MKKRIESFEWRYIEQIEGNVYILKDAREFKEVKRISVCEDRIYFWHDDCHDGLDSIDLEDILLFE